ncbi:O-glycosyl hydrolase [Amycolatopsis mediterranei S699]|uniref:O-glycosyl hydrolase n=2 Tax=Amycolatopsis mediterranei TaxID=33910 RepID=A0A0H3D1G3_AMYMU|nr:glycoside hydrolase family 30 beta sandwich domain-containing protein [Amycolatopsis mediterranei]ADJ44044.1 O-glycosyl hydrolase [Amycolatopsis mediterranei U32]AEK40777.1 O-glycosyl hydrolase [Amycolatopsis mediterranei S699]AFO75757.1 O-glycosyl hydrolase [Amycolatopsis mediterranei S699]AGT82886.1 O-glycosyl hydrolase [Amycolatopsis mediterranei RB]KDO06524.1 glucuronoxylanase [Amycolatopsis mediterranei]
MTPRRNQSEIAGSPLLNRRTVLAASAALPVLAVGTPAAAATAVVVEPSNVQQTILGFGGMNHTVWISDLTAAQRETAFGNGTGQLGFTVLRIPVHEDRNNWSREVATARRASELGAKVIASPWNPPASMTESFSGGKRLRYNAYGTYAQHLNDFTAFMANNGVNLYGISVQNEPDYAQQWTAWTASEIVKFLRENAGTISTRVIAPESFQYRKNLSDPILNDATALANVDIIGTHLYGTSFADLPYPLFQQKGGGKELWMTEVYYPNSTDSADLWPQALDVGEHIHRALVDGRFQTYVWWYIRRSYGPMREDGQISKRGACMAHFSKWVRPGFSRITATANPQANVYVSAFKSGARIVVVAINKNTSAADLAFTLRDTGSSTAQTWLTNASANLARSTDVTISNGAFNAQLPARSIRTFVVN